VGCGVCAAAVEDGTKDLASASVFGVAVARFVVWVGLEVDVQRVGLSPARGRDVERLARGGRADK
jgi:hypothetical protein